MTDRPPVLIRPAQPSDLLALEEMLLRCSPTTRYRRFHGVLPPGAHVRWCLAHLESLVAESAECGLVGLASTGPVPDAPGVREIGVVVEDGWQRVGVGRALVGAALRSLAAQGVERLRMQLCRAQPDLLRYLTSRPAAVVVEDDGCDVLVEFGVSAEVDGVETLAVHPAAVAVRPPRFAAERGCG